jgi:RNA polymerase primary sigma factor
MKTPKNEVFMDLGLSEQDTRILSKEEEQRLFQKLERIKNMPNGAREYYARPIYHAIILSNIRLIFYSSKKFTGILEMEDMFSQGIITLYNVIEHFDYKMGFKFSTYALHSLFRTFQRMGDVKFKKSNYFVEISEEPTYEQDFSVLEQEEIKFVVSKFMLKLNKKERLIVKHRYGLDGESPKTLEDIGTMVCVSKERVRQLCNQAIQKLKRHVKRKQLLV